MPRKETALLTADRRLPPVESYWLDIPRNEIVRSIAMRAGGARDSRLPLIGDPGLDLHAHFDQTWLRMRDTPNDGNGRQVRIADIFSGCGLMTLGIAEACRALGLAPRPIFAIDFDPIATSVYSMNFPTAVALPVDVKVYLDGAMGTPPTAAERELIHEIGTIDILVGGPPCQGHSDLNNHTRREDERNALFLRMARFAELVQPEHIIIENVRGILHDRGGVYKRTCNELHRLGYHIDGTLLSANEYGVAQRRQRFFLVASKRRQISLAASLLPYRTPSRNVGWACRDLLNRESSTVFDSSSTPSSTNKKRIEYLFQNDCYDLPDTERPDCHRTKHHSYKSVYGRLRWTELAQTITTGFNSMGQGRYVHPLRRRTITPHEAARLQFIPDFFRFDGVERAALAMLIGNAVPTKLTYTTALELLR